MASAPEPCATTVTAIAEALKVMFELEMTREVITARLGGEHRLN